METHPSTQPHKVVRVNISITPERLERLDRYAAEKEWPRSHVIGKLIDRLEVKP